MLNRKTFRSALLRVELHGRRRHRQRVGGKVREGRMRERKLSKKKKKKKDLIAKPSSCFLCVLMMCKQGVCCGVVHGEHAVHGGSCQRDAVDVGLCGGGVTLLEEDTAVPLHVPCEVGDDFADDLHGLTCRRATFQHER